ncbi:MAG: ribonuclease R [Gammaproteobacteria bacterium]|nr:MAG: ribonuclease R [Gammaproteobacteria bacterium]
MNKKKSADPHAAREAARYENPIPSREFILGHLEKSIGPLTHQELCREFRLADDDAIEALRRRLRAMERDGQTVRNRRGAYGTLDKMNLVKGRVSGHPEGFGFVLSKGADGDIFLSSRQMRRVMDGDEVLVRIAGHDRRGRPEGSIVEVVEHRTEQLVGRYFSESGIYFVRPDNPRISQDVLIIPEEATAAKPGQIVLVAITRQPSRNSQPAGRVIQVLGDHLAPGMEIELALHNFSLPHVWPKALGKQLAGIANEIPDSDKKNRIDLRHLPLVTIDGEDAKDFDDAVYCERMGRNGWRLFVAIADVSHYVAPGSELDIEAYERGNSIYFPGQVVPMLPEKLSNGLCSLKPEVDRLCMVCEMRIDTSGVVKQFQFYEAVMHSRARLTYTQVAVMIAERRESDSPVRQQFKNIVAHIDNLHDLYGALKENRALRGAIDFDTVETRILFDTERKIEQIIPTERTDAHRLIEECMLSANVCAATLLEKSKLPVLYRVHEGPREEKLEDLRSFLGELGLGLPGGDKPSAHDYQEVLNQAAGRPDADIIQSVMLRSMTQAVYQADNAGHFGLNYEGYTHFTSPIRRYPDLLVHRAIRALLRSKKRVAHLNRNTGAQLQALEKNYPYNVVQINEGGDHCSMTERRADEATRSVVNWLKCEYLLEHVGSEFRGVVSSVTGFGLFVELEPIYIDGLVHITGLPKDYYHHEAAHHRLVGERTGRTFRLGDVLQVRVARVDMEERKIDLELVDDGTGGSSKRKRKKQQPVASARAQELTSEHKERQSTGKKSSRKKSANTSESSKAKKTDGKKTRSKKARGKKSGAKSKRPTKGARATDVHQSPRKAQNKSRSKLTAYFGGVPKSLHRYERNRILAAALSSHPKLKQLDTGGVLWLNYLF